MPVYTANIVSHVLYGSRAKLVWGRFGIKESVQLKRKRTKRKAGSMAIQSNCFKALHRRRVLNLAPKVFPLCVCLFLFLHLSSHPPLSLSLPLSLFCSLKFYDSINLTRQYSTTIYKFNCHMTDFYSRPHSNLKLEAVKFTLAGREMEF